VQKTPSCPFPLPHPPVGHWGEAAQACDSGSCRDCSYQAVTVSVTPDISLRWQHCTAFLMQRPFCHCGLFCPHTQSVPTNKLANSSFLHRGDPRLRAPCVALRRWGAGAALLSVFCHQQAADDVWNYRTGANQKENQQDFSEQKEANI